MFCQRTEIVLKYECYERHLQNLPLLKSSHLIAVKLLPYYKTLKVGIFLRVSLHAIGKSFFFFFRYRAHSDKRFNSCNFILELLLPGIKVSGILIVTSLVLQCQCDCKTGSSEGYEFRSILTDPLPLYENKTYKVCFNTLKNETEGYLDLLELATLSCLLTKSDSRSFILGRAFFKSINYDVLI